MKMKLLALLMVFAFAIPLAVRADDTATETDPATDTVTTDTASDPVAELRAEIQDLKDYLQELKDQVESGELTKEAAQEAWQTAIADIREKKQALFEGKLAEVKVKYDQLAENDPELAEAIKARFEGFKAAREARHAKAQELRDSLSNGNITRNEFKTHVKEAQQEFKAQRLERREQFRDFIQGRRGTRGGNRGEAAEQ